MVTRCSDSRMRKAARNVGRETPRLCISSDSAGSASPWGTLPVMIWRRIWLATTSAALGTPTSVASSASVSVGGDISSTIALGVLERRIIERFSGSGGDGGVKKNPRRWTLLGAAIVGLTVAGVLVGQARAADQPKRVTGLSQVLDTLR